MTPENSIWRPLRNKVGHDFSVPFFFVAANDALVGGHNVYTYRHRLTRRYLNLDWSGQCYSYRPPSDYEPITDEVAFTHCFRTLPHPPKIPV